MAQLLNRVYVYTATTGSGTVTLGAAVPAAPGDANYQTWLAAGAVDGDTYSYLIRDGSAWEIGTGVIGSTGTTLTRVLTQSSTGSLLSLSGSATVTCVERAEDNLQIDDDTTSTGAVWSSDKVNAAVTAAGTGGTNQPQLNGLVSGGSVIWTTGLTFASTATSYYINGILYSAAAQTVTLNAADPADDRFDVIALDDTGTLVKITGTASSTPSVPTVDPSTQLALTIASVPAAATAPPGVSNESIYSAGAVWTITTSGSTWNTASSAYPSLGGSVVQATALTSGAYVRFNRGSGETLDATDILNFYIQSAATWPNKRTLQIQWRNTANSAVGQAVTLKSGAYGFNSSSTGTQQLIAIPISNFGLPAGTSVQYLQMTDAGGAIGFGINPITIQSVGDVVTPPTAGGITQSDADARYAQRANNLSDLSSASTSRTNLGAAASGAVVSSGLTMATARLLGRSTASTGAIEEITVGTGLSLSGGSLTASGSGGTVTTTGSPLIGQLTIFSAATTITNGNLSGDVTTSGSLATTLATVNSNTGSFGSATQVATFTVNGKGLITAAGSTTITAPTLQTGRTIAITGDLTYTSPTFDGSGNVTAAGTLATVNSDVGSFTNASITVNAKGLITAASSGSAGSVSTTGSPSSGNLTKFSGASSITNGDLAGDVTTSGALTTTVANINTTATVTATGTPPTNAPGYLGSPVSTALDSGNVAPGLTDGGKTWNHTDANARNFTIPANGSIAIPVGTILAIEQGPTAAAVSIIITSDTLYWGSSTGTRTLAANGGCSIQKLTSTTWRIRGEGIT